ncbi:MAG TPA: SLC13 family permease [bacterium]
MSAAGTFVLVLLGAATFAFLSGRWRPDFVAVAVLLALLLSGTLTPEEGFAGFGSPALLAVASIFVLGAALERVGLAAWAGRKILRISGGSELGLVLTFGLAAGLLAGIMNSLGAIAVLLPAAMAAAREARISPSKLLLPMALGTRLGGVLTLIAGPSNLIASQALVDGGAAPFGLFTFLPLGGAFLLVGMAFIAAVGRRWLPNVAAIEVPQPGRLMELYRLRERLFEVRIPADSPLAGQSIADSGLGRTLGVTVVGVSRDGRMVMGPSKTQRLHPGDRLLIQGRLEELAQAGVLEPLGLHTAKAAEAYAIESGDVRAAEVILPPRTSIAGKTLRELNFRHTSGLTVLAIWREGQPKRTVLADLPLQVGDALLVQGHRERIRLLQRDPDFLVIETGAVEPRRTAKAPWAVAAVVTMVAFSVSGLASIAVATLLAAGIVVAAGCLSGEEVYQAIDLRTLVFIGALLPLGTAFASTGAAAAAVGAALTIFGHSPVFALIGMLAAATAVNQVMPSVAATVVLAPVAFHIATATGGSVYPFMLAVVAGTGTTFTPIGNPVNLLVMRPGGYAMKDYVRLGVPLALLLIVLGALIIPILVPLRP